jgi:signal transduction histidine kinase
MLETQRIRQQEQDSLRKEIARDFHDEMGNQLTRIINYVSQMKLQANGHSSLLYNKVEDSAKHLYSGTRDFIWSIDPVNDELSRLFLHIRDFGEKLFEEKSIKFRAFNELKDEVVRLPYGFGREANLIFKEAMTNVFVHSNAQNVSFSLKRINDQYEMKLDDDGQGFQPEEVTKVNGIRNMNSRAKRLHATLHITSTENKGTLVSLMFKIQKSKVYDNAR